MKGFAVLIALLFLWAGLPARTATAAASVDYRIGSGPLGEALNAWATQSGVQLLYPPQIVSRRTSPGLSGRLTPQQALQRLLQSTGIEAAPVGGNAFVLRHAAPVRVKAVTAPVPAAVEQSHTQLPQVDVHGNALSRIAAATTTPTTTITREQIQASGYLSLFELLRAQPGVQVTRQPEAMSGDSAGTFSAGSSGASSVALRRLGAHATLLLLDGRRLADYGLAGSAGGGITDVGSIPLSMVERIDIIRDGAGTRYGADAMAGVIDITLRQRLDGGEITTLQGLSSRGDAGHRQISGALGEHFANGTDLLLMIDALDADPLLGDRRDWYTMDRRDEGLRDARSVFSFPGNWGDDGGDSLRAREGCDTQDIGKDGRCLSDTAKVTTLRTGKTSRSLAGHVRTPLSGPWDAYADLRVARTDQAQQSAPSAGIIVNPGAAGAVGGNLLYYGFWDVGPIRQRTRSEVARARFGLERKGRSWTFDNVVGVEDSRVQERITGLVNRERFADLAFATDYRFNQPVIDPQIALALAPPLDNRARSRVLDLASTTSGHIGGWSPGPISVDAGAQWRRETLNQSPDASLSSADLLIGRLDGRYDSARSVGAGYARFGVPLWGSLQADLGWRIERDNRFGSHATPALSLLWTPAQSLLLRAGVTRGWRTPSLLEQRPVAVDQGTYAAVVVPEALLPCAQPYEVNAQTTYCLLEQRSGYNPSLQPEASHALNIGFIWEPVERFSVGLDVYQVRRSEEIGDIPLSYALQHPDAFPGALVRNEAGEIEALNLFRVNLGRTTTRGVDLDLRWSSAPTRYGTFGIDVAANWLDELSFRTTPDAPEYERAGYAGQPRLTAIAALRWSRNAWSSTLLLRHTGSYRYRQYDGDTMDCPDYRVAAHKCSTPGFTLVNATVAYSGWQDWRVSLGVANLFDHTPEYYDEASGGYNPRFDDPVGRYFWLGATRRF